MFEPGSKLDVVLNSQQFRWHEGASAGCWLYIDFGSEREERSLSRREREFHGL